MLIYAFLNGVEIHWVRISTLFGDDQHLAYINTFIADPKLPDAPQFKHIHRSGWNCIIADLDYTQAKGLGLVLNEIDKTKDWEKHLVHIFKSCLVHYKR